MRKTFAALFLIFTALGAFAQPSVTYRYTKPIQNDTSTGTTQFMLVGTNPNAVIYSHTATNGYTGVCVDNCGTSGQAVIAFAGIVQLKVDGTTTAGHYILRSASVDGEGTDSGASTYPTSGGAVIGRVIVASTGAASVSQVDLFPAEIQAANAGFPEVLDIPSANCNNTTGGAGWSIGSGGTVTCRAGTNNKGGYISISSTSSTFAQFKIHLPKDWNNSTLPFVAFDLASADSTNGHTIIPQIQVMCSQTTLGNLSDDLGFQTAHLAATITIGASAVANGTYSTSVQMNSTDVTNCFAGGWMIIQVGRSNTDTATNANFYGAEITLLRNLTMQAN